MVRLQGRATAGHATDLPLNETTIKLSDHAKRESTGTGRALLEVIDTQV